MVRWGDDLPSLLEMAEAGQPVPALQTRPQLARRWAYTQEVYETLRGSRRYTMGGAANIPFSEFASYANYLEFPQWYAVELWRDLALMDNLFLTEHKAKQDAKSGS